MCDANLASRYFQLKSLSKADQAKFIEQNRGAYTAFGAITLALNLVPIGGLVFGLTSTIGAALWASDLEEHQMGQRVAQDKKVGEAIETAREVELL